MTSTRQRYIAPRLHRAAATTRRRYNAPPLQRAAATSRRSGLAAALAHLTHDRGGADDPDGGAGRGDRRVLLREAAAGPGLAPRALLAQHPPGLPPGHA